MGHTVRRSSISADLSDFFSLMRPTYNLLRPSLSLPFCKRTSVPIHARARRFLSPRVTRIWLTRNTTAPLFVPMSPRHSALRVGGRGRLGFIGTRSAQLADRVRLL